MKIKVLVIDDERLLTKSTCLALNAHGYETEGVLDGEEGYQKAIKNKPDVILLDIMMPGTDGWDILSNLKSNAITKDIPVVIFTAKEYSNGNIYAKQKGADDFIAKPFEIKDLCEIINSLTVNVEG